MSNNIILCFDGTDSNDGAKSASNILEFYKNVGEKTHLTSTASTGVDIGTSLGPIAQKEKSTCLDLVGGAFVARILAGMIEIIVLLNNSLESMVRRAWKILRNWETVDNSDPIKCAHSPKSFTQTFCRYEVSIEPMRLFDSVASVGIFVDRRFLCTSSTSNARYVRHASLFDPNQYLSHFCQSNRFNDCLDDDIESARSYSGIHLFDDGVVPGDQSIYVNIQQNCSTDLLEMWFPGDHADILSYAIEFGVRFKENSIGELNSEFSTTKTCLSFQHDVLSFKGYNYPDFVSPDLNTHTSNNFKCESALSSQSNTEEWLYPKNLVATAVIITKTRRQRGV
ncbi:hypothetical protein BOH78_4765 [Pichia kudriavzevii]|uniref:T6SS Phospholipase effector Tle1-like catalytic domain-containing protein n=1 Tax=Pichia kudriavzevii TaxID=4909 RepID=A0A1V2LG83_PICKU|nr:hypothetical protein BOH78_4765 [Pichia kudriavzevii]